MAVKSRRTYRRRSGAGTGAATVHTRSGGGSVKSSSGAKSRYGKKYKKGYRSEQYLAVATNIVAILMIIAAAILFYRLLSGKSTKLDVKAEDVAAFGIPYGTFANLKELSEKYNISFDELLTYYAIENHFFATEPSVPEKSYIEQSFIINYENIKSAYTKSQIEPYRNMVATLLDEIQYFPIPSEFDDSADVSYMYGNSWGAARDYGGERIHKGTDIVDRDNIRGRIPVVSMTDGTVEHIGWNEYGGFRVGIRTAKGTYYYYAHLDSFAGGLEQGAIIRAGELLGYMGDSGYSKKEGTKGNFVVHLHVGIAPETDISKDDFWINPYVFLRNAENRKISFTE